MSQRVSVTVVALSVLYLGLAAAGAVLGQDANTGSIKGEISAPVEYAARKTWSCTSRRLLANTDRLRSRRWWIRRNWFLFPTSWRS